MSVVAKALTSFVAKALTTVLAKALEPPWHLCGVNEHSSSSVGDGVLAPSLHGQSLSPRNALFEFEVCPVRIGCTMIDSSPQEVVNLTLEQVELRVTQHSDNRTSCVLGIVHMQIDRAETLRFRWILVLWSRPK